MAFDRDLLGEPYLAVPAAPRTAPLLDLINHPDAIWLCRMGTPIEQALLQIKALASAPQHG